LGYVIVFLCYVEYFCVRVIVLGINVLSIVVLSIVVFCVIEEYNIVERENYVKIVG
jgi:hypothetical protein